MLVLAQLLRSRARLLFAILAILFAGGAGVGIWIASRPTVNAAVPVAAVLDQPATTDVLVYVSGAVASPGLYRLSPDARESDAIAAAGGLLPDADPGHLPNLALRIKDGKQINVPFAKSGTTITKLDINTASIDELTAIPDMPEGLPQAIIDYRSQWDGFQTLSELRTVLGVDSATESAIGKYLKVVPLSP